MKKIVNISNQPKQRIALVTDSGENIDFYLEYKPRVESWFFSFKYKDLEAKNLTVCLHPNILRQFKRNIDFGIGFQSDTKVEPFYLDVFSTGKCNMVLLNQNDVKNIEAQIYNEQMEI